MLLFNNTQHQIMTEKTNTQGNSNLGMLSQ